MEIDRKINQKNAAGQVHGYWAESYHPNQINQTGHYCNGIITGYQERLRFNMNVYWRCHYLNGKEIGCEQLENNYQYFYKTPGVKFGEQIEFNTV